MSSTDKLILAIGGGVAFIIVVAVLLAWQAGRPEREKYRDTAARIRDRRKGDGRHGK